jgi:hypothetical protein
VSEFALSALEAKKAKVRAMQPKPQSFDSLCKSHNLDYTGNDVLLAYENWAMGNDPMFKALMSTNSGPLTVPRTSPLMVENMDGLMTEVLIREEHLKLMNSLVRVPSAGPIFEWNRHKGYGQRRGSVGFREGGGPTGGVSSFERKYSQIKFYGVLGGITHQMQSFGMNGGTIEDPDVRENQDRGMELLVKMEREVLFGDGDIKDANGNAVHSDGLLNQLITGESANVIDMKGKPLTYDNIDQAILNLVKKGKVVNITGFTSFMSVDVLDGLSRMYQDRNVVRHDKQEKQGVQYTPGLKVPGYDSQFGFLEFEPSIMLEEVEDSAPVAVADADAPAAPTVAVAAAADAASLLEADTYYYSVAACNDAGESLPTVSAAQAAVVGQKLTLTIGRVAAATFYRVYRGKLADGSDAKWIVRIPQTAAADPTYIDLNQWRTQNADLKPENGMCIIQRSTPTDLVFAQAMPLMKLPLPLNQTTLPFYLMLYGVPILKTPEKFIIFKNCGPYIAP